MSENALNPQSPVLPGQSLSSTYWRCIAGLWLRDSRRTLVDHASQGGINICATHKIPDQMPDYTRYLNLSPNCP